MTKKILGIDYGEKRVGIAISDEDRKMAFPKYVFQNDHLLIEKIAKVCEDEGIKEVVIGRSLDYKNKPNSIMEKIEELAKKIQKEKGIKVHLEDEFLTSAEAMRVQGNTNMLDASAAAIILRSFIEKNSEK